MFLIPIPLGLQRKVSLVGCFKWVIYTPGRVNTGKVSFISFYQKIIFYELLLYTYTLSQAGVNWNSGAKQTVVSSV